MSYYEPYSVRKARAERGDAPDVYQYDTVPAKLRVQLVLILIGGIGYYHVPGGYSTYEPANNNEGWKMIHDTLTRNLGVPWLHGTHQRENLAEDILDSLKFDDIDRVLDVLEVSCRLLEYFDRERLFRTLERCGAKQDPREAIDEINYRFRQAGVGFQFESGEIIRIDSQLVHTQVVKPALTLLRDPRFRGAEEEFLDAHKHYRSGDYREAITLANAAFESAMKCVCEIRGWKLDANARASDLLKALRANGLWPDYLDKSFDQLQATLASGLPKVRDNEGGHGQGSVPKEAPPYVASYALHLAAANIVYIVEAALAGET